MVPELANDDTLVGQELAGKYLVVSRLGAGGFGTVYSARNLALGTDVAVKVSRGPDADARTLREAQAAAGLRSPYTVRVYDVGRLAGGALFIVMELLPGRSLREWLTTRGTLPVALAASWIGHVCSALHEAHAQGLVHRDLKPSNLFVFEGPNLETHLKLLDFGLVKSVEAPSGEVTQSGTLIGSHLYMSPEQVRGVDVTQQSDIWALGVVLYEALSGKRPFERDTPNATLVAIASEPPRPLAEVAPGLPDEMYRIVSRCLRKAPKERFSSVRSLGSAFAALATPLIREGSSGEFASVSRDPERAEATADTRARREGRGVRWVVLAALAILSLAWFTRRSSEPRGTTSAALPSALSAAPRKAPREPSVSAAPAFPAPAPPGATEPDTTKADAGWKRATPSATAATPSARPTLAATEPSVPSTAPSSRLVLDPDF